MTTAKQWEMGHIIANQSTSETDQAIRQLTDQIAKLSVNLAQQQQPLQTQPTTTFPPPTPMLPKTKSLAVAIIVAEPDIL